MAAMKVRPRWLLKGLSSNNGMHPTRDTQAVINFRVVGGRVMPGVRPLVGEQEFKGLSGPSF